jgi:hypothetical protein
MNDEPQKADGDLREASDRETEDGARRAPSTSGATMWLGVVAVFGLMVCAWIAMFFFASKNQPADVRDQPAREAPAK